MRGAEPLNVLHSSSLLGEALSDELRLFVCLFVRGTFV